MMKLYSKEPIDEVLLNKSGSNGDIIASTSFNRNNRFSDIYINITTTGKLIPKVYRAYYTDTGSLKYHSATYEIIEASTNEEIIFKYETNNDYNYVTYRVEFEALENNTDVNINHMGLIFDKFEMTTENIKSFSCNLLKDINNKPLNYQLYTENLAFSIICNRTHVEAIVNTIEKPYYLVDIKDGCINNSSDELIETGIAISYLTGATKMIKINIQNIVGN